MSVLLAESDGACEAWFLGLRVRGGQASVRGLHSTSLWTVHGGIPALLGGQNSSSAPSLAVFSLVLFKDSVP